MEDELCKEGELQLFEEKLGNYNKGFINKSLFQFINELIFASSAA